MSERVVCVLANFTSNDGKFRLIYYTDSEPTDDNREDCELTCGELIAEFPEIIAAEADCYPIDKYLEGDGAIVF